MTIAARTSQRAIRLLLEFGIYYYLPIAGRSLSYAHNRQNAHSPLSMLDGRKRIKTPYEEEPRYLETTSQIDTAPIRRGPGILWLSMLHFFNSFRSASAQTRG